MLMAPGCLLGSNYRKSEPRFLREVHPLPPCPDAHCVAPDNHFSVLSSSMAQAFWNDFLVGRDQWAGREPVLGLRGVIMVGVPPWSPPVCLLSAVLPETSVQLLPITPGMYPWVRCQESGGTLITEWPLAQASCELLTWHTQILPMSPSTVHSDNSCWTLGFPELGGREWVSMCLLQGGEFMGLWYLINWSDMHTNGSCFV